MLSKEELRASMLAGVELFMSLSEEPATDWHVARPTMAARDGALKVIDAILAAELGGPFLSATHDRGISFEWQGGKRELWLTVNGDGTAGYLTAWGNEEKEEDDLPLDDAFLDKTVWWFVEDPKLRTLHEFEKLMALPEGESSWSPSRPKQSAMGLARAIADAINWEKLPIPIVSAGGDGTIHIKWRSTNGAEFQLFIDSDSIQYLAMDAEGKRSEGEMLLGEHIAALKS